MVLRLHVSLEVTSRADFAGFPCRRDRVDNGRTTWLLVLKVTRSVKDQTSSQVGWARMPSTRSSSREAWSGRH